MEIILLLLYFSIGIIAGLMSGIFGIGGGSVRIPLLNLAGLPLITAFGINLFVIPFSSLIGAITHRKNIDKSIAPYLVIGGTLGSITGAFLVGLISNIMLAILFVITAIITVLAIHLDKIVPNQSAKIRTGKFNILGISFFLNLLTGMRGGSGGSLFPAFLKAMKLNIHKAIATSLFATIFTAIFALSIYWQRGDLSWLAIVPVLAGSILGARVGSKLALKSKPEWLEIGLSIVIIVLALLTVYKSL